MLWTSNRLRKIHFFVAADCFQQGRVMLNVRKNGKTQIQGQMLTKLPISSNLQASRTLHPSWWQHQNQNKTTKTSTRHKTIQMKLQFTTQHTSSRLPKDLHNPTAWQSHESNKQLIINDLQENKPVAVLQNLLGNQAAPLVTYCGFISGIPFQPRIVGAIDNPLTPSTSRAHIAQGGSEGH